MDAKTKWTILTAGRPGTMQMSPSRLLVLYLALSGTLANDVPGEVVEAGCNEGYSALFLRRVLDWWNPTKELHVYDSFAGLRDLRAQDCPGLYPPGWLRSEPAALGRNFAAQGLQQPAVHAGNVEDTMPRELPDVICFAHLDMDLYAPTRHALEAVYPRLSPGGVLVVDDYGNRVFPGIKLAVTEFCDEQGVSWSDLDLQTVLAAATQAILWKPTNQEGA